MHDICAACDDNFFEHFCTMAVSLFAHNPGARLHLIGLNLSEQSLSVMDSICKQNGFDIVHYPADRSALDHLQTSHHLPTAVWCRMMIPTLLPADLARVVYLDCDVIVLGDLSELASWDLEGAPLAMVADPAPLPVLDELKTKLGMHANSTYYNSGVMIMDVEKFRTEKIVEPILAFAVNNPEKLSLMDQCAINAVLQGRISELPKRFNLHPALNDLSKTDCKVLHYMGRKPWQARRPLSSIAYLKYREMLSDWFGPPDPSQISFGQMWSSRLKIMRRTLRSPFSTHNRQHLLNDLANYAFLKKRIYLPPL